MPKAPLARRMAEAILAIRAETLPQSAIDWTATVTVDTVGVALAGLNEDCTRILREVEGVEAGRGDCLVWGTRSRTTALDAALINGTASHALDYDDMAATAATHPSAVIVPVLFALGEREGTSGRDFVAAYVAGYEMGVRLSQALYFHHYEKGWHPTATLGTFSAAASAAHLLRLDVDQTATALALSASMASGIKANFGTMTKPFHAGQSARAGLLAAELAARGFTAKQEAFEHSQGFFNVFNGPGSYDAERAMDGWSDPLAIVGTDAGIKVFPCCGSTHAGIEAAFAIRRDHAPDLSKVERIEIHMNPRRFPHTDNKSPTDRLGGKFSQQYVVSRALKDGEVLLSHFETDALDDPEVRALMAKVILVPAAEFDNVAKSQFGGRLVIRMADGKTFTAETTRDPWPTNKEPLAEDTLFGKFNDCARRALPRDRIASAFEALMNIADLPDLRGIGRLLEVDDAHREKEVNRLPRVVAGGEWIP